MSDKPQTQPKNPSPAQDNSIPFILQSLGWALLKSPLADGSPAETEPAQGPDWDISHMQYRSYDFESIGELFLSQGPPTPPPSSSARPKSGRKQRAPLFYKYHHLPELTLAQVQTLFDKFLSDNKPWNQMTRFLQQKLIEGKMAEHELQGWKDMCRSVLHLGSIEDLEAYKRRFCNYFLLWFVAVDIRYGYEVADGFAKMVETPQLTLIFNDEIQFALYKVRYIDVDESQARLSGEKEPENRKPEEKSGASATVEKSS